MTARQSLAAEAADEAAAIGRSLDTARREADCGDVEITSYAVLDWLAQITDVVGKVAEAVAGITVAANRSVSR